MAKLLIIITLLISTISCTSNPPQSKEKQIVYKYLYRSLPKLRSCWLPYLKKKIIKDTDSIVLEFDIKTNGRVTALKGQLSSAYIPLRIKKCVLYSVAKIRFPRRAEQTNIRTKLAFK